MASIRRLPITTPIYTNGPQAIYYLTGRPAATIPWKVDLVAGRENARYADELAELHDRLASDTAVVVYFNRLADRWWLPSEEKLREALPLVALTRSSDGTVYRQRADAVR